MVCCSKKRLIKSIVDYREGDNMSTESVYLQKRVKRLTEALLNAEKFINVLLKDSELTESMGCAFAFDLASRYPDIAASLIQEWESATKEGTP